MHKCAPVFASSNACCAFQYWRSAEMKGPRQSRHLRKPFKLLKLKPLCVSEASVRQRQSSGLDAAGPLLAQSDCVSIWHRHETLAVPSVRACLYVYVSWQLPLETLQHSSTKLSVTGERVFVWMVCACRRSAASLSTLARGRHYELSTVCVYFSHERQYHCTIEFAAQTPTSAQVAYCCPNCRCSIMPAVQTL